MGTYVEVKLEEFDALLKKEKGWERNVTGNEYVYDYKMKEFPHLMIKVLTSIKVDTTKARKAGHDAIRVFVVVIDKDGKITRGYAKQIRVNRTMNWRDNVRNAFIRQRAGMFARKGR